MLLINSMDIEMPGSETNPEALSLEQLRANAFAAASYNLNQIASGAQKEVILIYINSFFGLYLYSF
jgi:hypothetical protein